MRTVEQLNAEIKKALEELPRKRELAFERVLEDLEWLSGKIIDRKDFEPSNDEKVMFSEILEIVNNISKVLK